MLQKRKLKLGHHSKALLFITKFYHFQEMKTERKLVSTDNQFDVCQNEICSRKLVYLLVFEMWITSLIHLFPNLHYETIHFHHFTSFQNLHDNT